MKFGKSIFAIGAAGIAAVLIGLYIRTLDVGSCPAISNSGSNLPPCYHTFQNTNILIYPTGTLVIEAGVVLLLAAFVVGLYGHFSGTRNTPPLKPQNEVASTETIKNNHNHVLIVRTVLQSHTLK